MTNLEVLRLFNTLTALTNQDTAMLQTGNQSPLGAIPGRFSVKAAYNIRALRPEAEKLQAALQGPFNEVLNAYEAEERELIRKHAGLPDDTIIAPNVQYVMKDMAGFTVERDKLREAHPGLTEALKARETAYEILNQEAPPILLQKVGFDDLPTTLTLEQGDILLPMVDVPAPAPVAAA